MGIFCMHYFVYILYSEALDRYYIGHTGEFISERLRKHLSTHKGYTSKAKDWVLKYSEKYTTKQEAHKRELEIKRKKSRKYIERIISKG